MLKLKKIVRRLYMKAMIKMKRNYTAPQTLVNSDEENEMYRYQNTYDDMNYSEDFHASMNVMNRRILTTQLKALRIKVAKYVKHSSNRLSASDVVHLCLLKKQMLKAGMSFTRKTPTFVTSPPEIDFSLRKMPHVSKIVAPNTEITFSAWRKHIKKMSQNLTHDYNTEDNSNTYMIVPSKKPINGFKQAEAASCN
jgi:hypothetical protein